MYRECTFIVDRVGGVKQDGVTWSMFRGKLSHVSSVTLHCRSLCSCSAVWLSCSDLNWHSGKLTIAYKSFIIYLFIYLFIYLMSEYTLTRKNIMITVCIHNKIARPMTSLTDINVGYCTRLHDWSAFSTHVLWLMESRSVDPTDDDVDQSYADFLKAIASTVDLLISKTKRSINTHHRKVPFWIENCRTAIKPRDEALKNEQDLNCCTEFYRLKCDAKKTIENEKQD